MARRAQVWTACIWTAVMVQSVRALVVRYPALNDSETLECECRTSTCQYVQWYWQPRARPGDFRFLLYYSIVDRELYHQSGYRDKYKPGRKGGTRPIYSLKISNVRETDAGRYFCQLPITSRDKPSIPAFELRPGEMPPTPPPPPPPPKTRRPCRCQNRGNNKSPQGCGSLVLWPLVGVLSSLAVMLIATLYYFSRLPKKCRHRFVKKKQLR